MAGEITTTGYKGPDKLTQFCPIAECPVTFNIESNGEGRCLSGDFCESCCTTVFIGDHTGQKNSPTVRRSPVLPS